MIKIILTVFCVIYLIAIIAVGAYFMSNDCSSVNSSNQKFTEVKTTYDESLKNYNTAVENLNKANTLIDDSECVLSGMSNFINETIKFGNYRSLGQYGINLQSISDPSPSVSNVVVYDNIQQYEIYCKFGYDYTQSFCNSNCFQWTCQRFCDPEHFLYSQKDQKLVSRSCNFNRKIYTYEHYGIFVKGSGGISLSCGQFTHSMTLRTSEYLISSRRSPRTFIGNKMTEENIDNFHGSSLIFESKNPSTQTVEKKIMTTSDSINNQINDIYSFIQNRIKEYSIQNLNYEDIRLQNIEKIPELEKIVQEQKVIMNSKKENLDSQKSINDNINFICNKSYELWLPLIFVIPFVLIIITICVPSDLCEGCCENFQKETHKETPKKNPQKTQEETLQEETPYQITYV